MEIVSGDPEEFSEAERERLRSMVDGGGEVSAATLRHNIESAKALVFGRIDDAIEAVAALKRPLASYRDRIGESAGFALPEGLYPFEVGYVLVSEGRRGGGVSHRLVAEALWHAGGTGTFATARTDNAAILKALDRAGFVSVGNDYKGRGRRRMRLLVRQGSVGE